MPPEPLPDEHYLHERYLSRRRPRLLRPYYLLKPLLPRRAQLALRRAYAHRQRRRRFPAWPIEPLLIDRRDPALRAHDWPAGHRFAFVLTHDVEGPRGLENIERVLEVERRHGMVSSWNLVGEDYPIPREAFAAIRAAGGEIGLHGLSHDGHLFDSRAHFEAALPRIRELMAEWGAVGFRSPATHRDADWIAELGCSYDSSFPDTDPFEPQPGGCCSILPFMLGDVVELPITLVQDHTLFEILREPTIALWREKSTWIAERGGLVNVIVHPDYVDAPGRLERYEELLLHLRSLPGGWHALPRDVAAWWRRRVAEGERIRPEG